MPRYIDADRLIEFCLNNKSRTVDANDIARFPCTADVVEVIRCKDCAFCEDPRYRGNAKVDDHIKFCCQGMEPFLVHDDYFCASGTTLEEINE